MAIVDQKRSALAGALRDGAPRPGPQGALLRPGLLRAGGRAALAAGLADGVPARGDPAAARLRRVRDPRPVGHRAAHRRHGGRARSRTPAATAASRSSRAAGRARAGSPARSTAGATALDGTNTARPAAARRSPSTTCEPGRHRPRAGAVRDVGRLRVDQPRRRRAAAAAVPRAGRHDPRRVEGGVAADRVVVRVPPPGELEARDRGVRRAVPRACETHPQLVIPGAVRAARRRAVRPAGVRRRRDPVPAHDERRHGRHGARQRRARRRGPARPRAARRPDAGDGDVEPHAQRRGRALAPRRGATTSPTSTSSTRRASTSRSATASRTTSCCRCTAARRRTGSARSDRRRR